MHRLEKKTVITALAYCIVRVKKNLSYCKCNKQQANYCVDRKVAFGCHRKHGFRGSLVDINISMHFLKTRVTVG